MSSIDGDLLSARPASPGAPQILGAPASPAMVSVDVNDLFKAVIRRPRLLIPSVAATLLLAGFYIVVTPPRYTATMSILVDTRERPPVGVDTQIVSSGADAAIVDSQMRLITSTTVLRRVAETEKLRLEPEFSGGPSTSMLALIKGTLLGETQDREASTDRIANALSKSVATRRSEKSYVIDVDVRASTREMANRLARAIATAYFETQSKMGDDIVARQSEWIDKKIIELRTRVAEAERNADEFRSSHALFITEGRLLPEQQLKDANTALIEARGTRADLQSKHDQLQVAIRSGGSIDSLNEAISSPLITKLRGDYAAASRDEANAMSTFGPLHPAYRSSKALLGPLRDQINAELKRIATAQDRDLQAARQAERSAERLVADLQTSIGNFGPPKIQLDELDRRATALRDRYEKALAARENLRRDVVSFPNSVLIDDPYTDAAPTSPKTLPALVIALAAGINLWIASALIAEYLSRRQPKAIPLARPSKAARPAPDVKKPRAPVTDRGDTQPALKPANLESPKDRGGPFVIELPDVDADDNTRKDGQADIGELASRAMSKPNGSYRTKVNDLYDALLRRIQGPGSPPIIAIASSEAGMGVSTIAVSLAYASMARGKRVLLVERHSAKAISAPHVRPQTKLAADDGLRAFHTFKREIKTGGEILSTCWDGQRSTWPVQAKSGNKLDYVFVDCGALNGGQRLVPPTDEIGALLLVDSPAPDGHIENLLYELKLADRFAGIVRAATYAKRSRVTT